MSRPKITGFSSARAVTVAWRVLRQISRDRRTLGMMIVMPAVIMFVFGFALSGEVKNVPVYLDNQDRGFIPAGSGGVTLNVGAQVVTYLQGDDRLQVTVGSFTDGKAGVDGGAYFASILIPGNFSQSVFMLNRGQKASASLQLYIDGTEPAVKASILGALQNSLQDAQGGRGVTLNQQFAFGGAQFTGLDVSIPTVVAFVLTFLVLLVSLIIVSREATSGTLSRLYATPLSALERLLGYSLALLLLSVVMSGVILGIGVGIFGAVVRGNLLLLFGSAVLYALAHIFLAVFLSGFARNELQAVQMAPLIALPSMALSGMLIPVSSLPVWVQYLSKFVPMYYGNRIFEGIMLKGYGLGELLPDFAVIGGVALLFLLLATRSVRDRIIA